MKFGFDDCMYTVGQKSIMSVTNCASSPKDKNIIFPVIL